MSSSNWPGETIDLTMDTDSEPDILAPVLAPLQPSPFAHRPHPFRSPTKLASAPRPVNGTHDRNAPSTAGATRIPPGATTSAQARSAARPASGAGISGTNGSSTLRCPAAPASSNVLYTASSVSGSATNGAHRNGYASSSSVPRSAAEDGHQTQPHKRRKMGAWPESSSSSAHPFSTNRADPISVDNYNFGPYRAGGGYLQTEAAHTTKPAHPTGTVDAADFAAPVSASRTRSVPTSSVLTIPPVHVPDPHPESYVRDSISISPVKKANHFWTDAETRDLYAGVRRFGVGKWTEIQNCPDLHFLRRTARDLENQYRVLELDRAAGITEKAKGKRPVDDTRQLDRDAREGERARPTGTEVNIRRTGESSARIRNFTAGDAPTRSSLNAALSSSRPYTETAYNPSSGSEDRPLFFGRSANDEDDGNLPIIEDIAKAIRRDESTRISPDTSSSDSIVGATSGPEEGAQQHQLNRNGVATDTEAILRAYEAEQNGMDKRVDDAALTVTHQSSTAQRNDEHGNAYGSINDYGVADDYAGAIGYSTAIPGSQSPYPQQETLHSSQQQPPPTQGGQTTQPGPRKRFGKFTEEENHLIIFLKEWKLMGWNEIWHNFRPFFPHRTKGGLNTHYCTNIGRRKRINDPPLLKLPKAFAHDPAAIGRAVFADPPPPPANYAPGPPNAWTMAISPLPKLTQGAESTPRRGRGRPRKCPSSTAGPRSDPPEHAYEDAPFYIPDSGSIEEPFQSGYSTEQTRMERRPRRNVQPVDYTLPGLRLRSSPPAQHNLEADNDSIVGGVTEVPPTNVLADNRARPEITALPYEKPLDVAPEQDIQLLNSVENLPYLSFTQREIVQTGSGNTSWDRASNSKWKGSVLHVDFNPFELVTVENVMERLCGGVYESRSLRKRFKKTLLDQAEPKLLALSYELRKKLRRDHASVDAFIQDAKEGHISRRPHVERLATARPQQAYSSSLKGPFSVTALLRQRELGLQSRRGWKTASTSVTYETKNGLMDTLGPAYSWSGASSDVHALAWSPDGKAFIAGACCVTNVEQYNLPNNLVYGDLEKGTVRELREHFMELDDPTREHTSTISPKKDIFCTVSSVAFSEDGSLMFSASYDKKVVVWSHYQNGERLSQPTCNIRVNYKAKVELMSVHSAPHAELLATAAQRYRGAIKVCEIPKDGVLQPDGGLPIVTFSSTKAGAFPDYKILPQALSFEPRYGRRLLAGFGANRSDRDANGDICLWDVYTQTELKIDGSSRNIFDVAWMPDRDDYFAVGCIAHGHNINRGTRSVIRLYNDKEQNSHFSSLRFGEMECRALDMNDVVFCPWNQNLIAAGCTSGSTFVWDLRRPDHYLFELAHGSSIQNLPHENDREVEDTGVRFLSWGDNASRLYTGSSDGIVKIWDVTHHPEDVFVKDLISLPSGVMAGAFTEDRSRLLLGDVLGAVTVLDIGNEGVRSQDAEKFTFMPWDQNLDPNADATEFDSPAVDTAIGEGVAAARELLSSGQMMTVPFGALPFRQAVQGPTYNGPFDNSDDAPAFREKALDFQRSFATAASGAQCAIPACTDVTFVTSEEDHESGRSDDRIPAELRKQFLALGQKTVGGMTKCAKCGRPARPDCGRPAEPSDLLHAPTPTTSTTAASAGTLAPQLCERCSFACFRCGGRCRMKPETERLVCETCLRVWEAGVLGYECVEETACRDVSGDVPLLPRYAEFVKQEKRSVERDEVCFGDEMNALSEYYLGLGIDERLG